MLRIATSYVETVRAARKPEDLHEMVQKAIELEHATIPAYLAAYLTLKPGMNQVVGRILRSILVEEMLHMSIASNLLIALGGSPVIDKPGFVPKYPSTLPMNIGDGLVVGLEKCTAKLVREVFMKIEEPEHPIVFKVALAAPEFSTIGQFYAALDAKLQELGQAAFVGDFSREMVADHWFSPGELFRIDGPKTASAAIAIIVEQGEGTKVSPLDPAGALAHYYRFQQIPKGKALIADPAAPNGYSFSGATVALDERGVWNMQPNGNPDDLPEGSQARLLATQFAYAYTQLLRVLHRTFNGEPELIDRAMGSMYELRLLAQDVLATELPGSKGVQTGLSFRYQASF